MDRRREDVRDSFLDMVDAENETALLALKTPLEVSRVGGITDSGCRAQLLRPGLVSF